MCIISTAQQASPKVIGHMEPCLAQLTTLSAVAACISGYVKDEVSRSQKEVYIHSTYSIPFLGVSKLSWLLPFCAKRATSAGCGMAFATLVGELTALP
jgi:hypothetical protein